MRQSHLLSFFHLIIYFVILFERLSRFNSCSNVSWVKSIVWDFAPNELPQHCSKCKDIHTFIVLSLLEKLRSHVNRCSSKLHWTFSDISLKKKFIIWSWYTYFESCESKVADFNLKILVDENVLALNVTVHNAESMHVVENLGCLETNKQSFLYRQLNLFLHVKHLE